MRFLLVKLDLNNIHNNVEMTLTLVCIVRGNGQQSIDFS